MKKIGILLVMVSVILCFMGTAIAYTTYSSPVTAANMWMSYSGGSSNDTFTLMLDSFNSGNISSCSSAQLILSFSNDGNPFDNYEFAGITESGKSTIFEVENGSPMIITISKDGLNTLSSTGQLTFILTRYCGDFTFKTAKLSADCTAKTPPVPIPATLWLFGPTLIGFLFMRRQFVQA